MVLEVIILNEKYRGTQQPRQNGIHYSSAMPGVQRGVSGKSALPRRAGLSRSKDLSSNKLYVSLRPPLRSTADVKKHSSSFNDTIRYVRPVGSKKYSLLCQGTDIPRCIQNACLPAKVRYLGVEDDDKNMQLFLEGVLVLECHSAYKFFSEEDVRSIRKLALMRAAYDKLNRVGIFSKYCVSSAWECTWSR